MGLAESNTHSYFWQIRQSTVQLLDNAFIFDRCRSSLVAVTPVNMNAIQLTKEVTIRNATNGATVYAHSFVSKYAHSFVVFCFVVVMQSFVMKSHEVFIHIHQGCFAGIGAIVRLPQCQWSKPHGYGKISQCITTTKHSKTKTVCLFLGLYCITEQASLTPPHPHLFVVWVLYTNDPQTYGECHGTRWRL